MKTTKLIPLTMALASIASASTLTLTGVSGETVYGSAASPYTISIDGGPDIQAWCDDFIDNSFIGQSWDVNILDASQVSQAYFGSTNPAGYQTVFALIDMERADPNPNLGAYQAAIWSVFDPQFPSYANSDTLKAETIGYDVANLADFRIADGSFIDTGGIKQDTRNQELIFLQAAAVHAPEPSALEMAGMGFALLTGGFWKKRRS